MMPLMKGSTWLILLGILILLLSLFADTLGIGTSPRNYFGWKQILGLVVGLVLIGYGLRRRRS
jgi:uncharacterized membrane protein